MAMSALPAFEDIADNLSLLDDWEDRYRYLIELGQMLPGLAESEKTAEAKVSGCVSQVWLVVDNPDTENRLHFRGDSDAMIVRGLVAVLISLYSGKTAKEVADTDAIATLDGLNLREHLTAQRSNGLVAMVRRMREEGASRV